MTTLGPDTINPIAMQIGMLIGLFTKEQDTYTFNSKWFNDPWKHISDIPSNPALFDLLATLMGSANGNALGTPRQVLNRTWYPVLNPVAKEGEESKPTGIYIVAGKPVNGMPTEVGLGGLYEWKYDDFSLLPYAYFPVLSLPVKGGSGVQFILGQDGHPVETGINITGADGVFNTGNGDASLSFDGFQVASQIYFAAGKYPSLDLGFLNLKLPGEKQGSNRSLFDLIANASVQQSITVALSVLGSQLSQMEGAAGTAGKMVHSILELLGLLGPVPGIDWNALVKDPAKVGSIFTDWLQNITRNNTILKSWLNDWYCLFKGLDATDDENYVTGTGQRTDPFSANLLALKVSETLSVNFDLTFATLQTPEGALQLYPGFRISSTPINPISSMPAFGVKVLAEAETLCYTIPAAGSGGTRSISFFPSYHIMASAANTDATKPLFAVADTFGAHALDKEKPATFSIGSMNVGFSYNSTTATSKVPTPNFQFFEVQTAIGSWPLIDLANFDVRTLEEAIGPVVSGAIKAFFGEDNKYAEAFTAVLGIDPPVAYDKGAWPLKDKMLLSADELALLIKNPFAALGAYYSRCLSTDDGVGKPLFQYLVSSFATLLGSDTTTVTGAGTKQSPWQIPLLTLGTATLHLGLWKPGDDELAMAFDFTVPLPIKAVSATFKLSAAMMVMKLPGNEGKGAWDASWMQAITGKLIVKDAQDKKLQTPDLGGVSIAVKDIYVEAGWKNAGSFFMVAGIDELQLNSSAGPVELGNMEFSTIGWDSNQLKQFTPAIVNGLGLLLLENGGTIGVLVTITLGLLPNLPKIFDGYTHEEYKFPVPEYLILPKGWPVLKIENFSNPWKDVVKQLSALYANGDFMVTLMQVIGWGITGETPGAPDVIPTGTMADPWSVNLPDLWNIDLLTWKENKQSGYGIQRQFSVNAAKSVQIATVLRADVPGVMLDGVTGPTNNYPGIALITQIQNPDIPLPLIDLGGLVIDKVQIGAFLQLIDGKLQLMPVFRFQNSRLAKNEIFRDIELIPVDGKPQFTSNDLLTAFNTLVNTLMEKLSETAQGEDFKQLQAFLDLLGLLGVLDVVVEEDTLVKQYSFNSGAWASILANPLGYFTGKTQAVLQSDTQCAILVKALAQLMGYENFKIPAVWQGVQYLLQSLSLAKDYSGTFIPQFNNWLALIKSPVNFLKDSVSRLFNSPELIKQLVTDISKLVTLPKAGAGLNLGKYFSVDTSGTIITVHIPTDKVLKIGDELQLYAGIVIDVNAYSVTNSVAIGSSTLDSALSFSWTPSFTNGQLSNDFGFYLTGIPGAPQAFEPLALWPFPVDTQKYLKQIGYQVPVTLLSSFAVKYLNNYVVPSNPAVSNIFKVLGLTSDVEGTTLIKPLTGIFMKPVEWLMSTDVLGNDAGGVDLTKFGQLLYAVTDAAGIKVGDVALKAYGRDGKNDGIQLTGLPWGVGFTLSANTQEGAQLRGSFTPTLPAPAPQITLQAGVGFGTANGLGIDGSINMSYSLGKSSGGGDNKLGVTAAYTAKGFSLTANANKSEFKLLPFGGLNQFLGEGVSALLTIVGDKLFGAYDEYVVTHPDTALKPFVTSIRTLTGIENGTDLYNFFHAIYENPLGQFTEANIATVMPRIETFVSKILGLGGFALSADKKLLTYKYALTAPLSVQVKINIGLREVDGKTIFGLWLEPVAGYSWLTMGLSNTGVGVVMPVDYKNPDLRYEVNMTVGADFTAFKIPHAPLPTLVFGLKGNLQGIQGPNLNFYPVKVSADPGTLQVALLPAPKLIIVGRKDVSLATWMINFGTEFLVPFIANTALGISSVKKWLDETKIGNIAGVPGKVLQDWGLLEKEGANYYLSNIRKAFDINDPVGIVTKLIFSALNLLDGQRVVPIKEQGIYVQSEMDGKKKRYGLRIQITDIEVSNSLNSDGAKLLFQIGKYYGNQNKEKNWTGLKSDPGFVVYFVSKDTVDKTLSFLPKFELISVGLDFAGANDQTPLINAKGVTIQAIQPRAYVSLNLDGEIKTDFGAGMMLYSLGVPLGPGFNNQGPNGNPVAQNLLASGGNPGKTAAINPAFSIATSYVYNAREFSLQLYDSNNLPADKIWISVMRAFGPLQCRKVGIGWKGDKDPKQLDFLFDGQVSLAGLMANLVELDIGIPITNPTDFGAYTLDLAGLDVSYNAGAVSIGGGFLKDESAGYIQYTGQAKIQTASFGIGAFGAYALIDKHPSLFIFAYLNAPLGGPPCFFITGLSGGFGYNRTINIPAAKDIERFPFVAGITDPVQLGGSKDKPPTNEQALQALGTKVVPPQLGSYWVAAGIMFSSFQLINSKAVLMVIFGNDFEIALVGLSGLQLPKTGKTYVGAQIAFKVTYKVSTGLLAMEAVLTSNSYVIDPNCRLTGGLAFYVWFKDQPATGARAGDFVFTLGGYHPAFKKPAFYPDEPRLGFSWAVGDTVSIKGGAYFALTPSAVMAGGSLEAVYQSGNLKAWFTAYADFLIMWNPFYYDIRVGVSVGASYTVKFIWTTTFKVELGADVHIWGPAMAGSATVHWWVISFTVRFGATGTNPNDTRIIGWDQFEPYFLPQDQKPADAPQQQPQDSKKALKAANTPVMAPVQQVTHIKQTNGLLKELPNPNTKVNTTSPILWQIGADGFSFAVSTVVPLNEISIEGSTQKLTSDVKFGIRPMGNVVMGKAGQLSSMTFTLKYGDTVYKDFNNWVITPEFNGVPESLWGTVNNGKTEIGAKLIPGALVGLSARIVSAADNLPKNGPPKFPLSNLGYATWAWRKLTLANNPKLHPTIPAKPSNTSLDIIENTIMSFTTVATRTAVLKVVQAAGIPVVTDGRLDQMAAYASETFQSFPMLGELGSLGYTGTPRVAATGISQTFSRRKPMVAAKAVSSPVTLQPAMRAVMYQYAQPVLPSPVFLAASQQDIKLTRPVKGKMYSPENTEQWKVRAAMPAGNQNAPAAFELYPGKSVILDLDPLASAPVVKLQGKGSIFGAWFDEDNQLLGCEVLHASQTLPQGITEMMLTGIDVAALKLPYAYGWHVTSQLTLVNPNALTGIGAVIIPDSPIRIKYKRRTGGFGLITGEKMVQRNLIMKGEESVSAGIKTIMPVDVKTLAVLALKKDKRTPFDSKTISVMIRKETAAGPEYVPLTAGNVIDGEYEAAVLYDLPENTGLTYHMVYTQADTHTTITGVMGLAESRKAATDGWQQVVLQPALPYPYTVPETGTQVTIEQH